MINTKCKEMAGERDLRNRKTRKTEVREKSKWLKCQNFTVPGCGLTLGGTDVLLEFILSEGEVAGVGIDLLESVPDCCDEGDEGDEAAAGAC